MGFARAPAASAAAARNAVPTARPTADHPAVDWPGGCATGCGRERGAPSVTTSDLPTGGQPDVSGDTTEAPFDDVINLSTSTGDDGAVTVRSEERRVGKEGRCGGAAATD